MLEYFTYKKLKKHNGADKEKHEHGHPELQPESPLLNEEDAHFLRRIVSEEGTPPPLPNRPTLGPVAGDHAGNASQMVLHNGRTSSEHKRKHSDKGKGKEKSNHLSQKFAFLHRSGTKKGKTLSPTVPTTDPATETSDLNRVLEDLNLSAINNRAFSLSKESQVLVQKFTLILKDLINGVPTAYDDLTHLLDDSQGTLSKSYDHLPSFLQKLIQQLPEKMKGTLGPELLAVAAEAQALGGKGGKKMGMADAAKHFMKPTSLKNLVEKPGAIAGLLKTIMNALKLRWPAFMGTNVLLSLGLFVLLFVFWYCHKRGREVRLEREAKVDSEGRIIELPDDPLLSNGESSSSRPRRKEREGSHRYSSNTESNDDDQEERARRERRRRRRAEERGGEEEVLMSGGSGRERGSKGGSRVGSGEDEEEDRRRAERRRRRREEHEREKEREREQRPSASRRTTGTGTGTGTDSSERRRRRRSDDYVSSGGERRERDTR